MPLHREVLLVSWSSQLCQLFISCGVNNTSDVCPVNRSCNMSDGETLLEPWRGKTYQHTSHMAPMYSPMCIAKDILSSNGNTPVAQENSASNQPSTPPFSHPTLPTPH
jgi:hypothetical protein